MYLCDIMKFDTLFCIFLYIGVLTYTDENGNVLTFNTFSHFPCELQYSSPLAYSRDSEVNFTSHSFFTFFDGFGYSLILQSD